MSEIAIMPKVTKRQSYLLATCPECRKTRYVPRRNEFSPCWSCYNKKRQLKDRTFDQDGNVVSKRCSKCLDFVPIADFHRTSRSFDGLQRACKKCSNKYRIALRDREPQQFKERRARQRAKWYAANRDKHLRTTRNAELRRKFGITLERYEALLASQDGKCGLCGTTEPKGQGSFHVDHCHETGKIRGLLCHHCNTHLGIYEKVLSTVGKDLIDAWLRRSVGKVVAA